MLWTSPEALQVRFLVFNVVGGYIAGRFALRQFAQLCLSFAIEHFSARVAPKPGKSRKTEKYEKNQNF